MILSWSLDVVWLFCSFVFFYTFKYIFFVDFTIIWLLCKFVWLLNYFFFSFRFAHGINTHIGTRTCTYITFKYAIVLLILQAQYKYPNRTIISNQSQSDTKYTTQTIYQLNEVHKSRSICLIHQKKYGSMNSSSLLFHNRIFFFFRFSSSDIFKMDFLTREPIAMMIGLLLLFQFRYFLPVRFVYLIYMAWMIGLWVRSIMIVNYIIHVSEMRRKKKKHFQENHPHIN